MRRRIIVERGVSQRIATLKGVSPQFVNRCLCYGARTEGLTGRSIRRMALEMFGGVEIGQEEKN